MKVPPPVSDAISLTLPDGSVRQMPRGTTGADVAASIGPGLLKAALAAKVANDPKAAQTLKDDPDYLALMKDELGDRWVQPDLFRFGASSLLGDIERQLEHHITGSYSATYRHAMA
jgi:hypothetical protein